MIVLAIDPGNEQSAWVLYDGLKILDKGRASNEDVLSVVSTTSAGHLAIEMIASYGMAVGASVFDTCVWIGRFIQAAPIPSSRVYRLDVKLHVCKSPKANDATIRQALMDRFGAPGTKASPGKTYGVSKDMWSALGVAVTWWETKQHGTSLILADEEE